MKVLLISSSSGSRGGGEIYLRYLAEGLSGIGCEVHVLLAAHTDMDELAAGMGAGVRVHRLALTNTYRRATRSLGAVIDMDQRRRVRAFIDWLAPDIAHVNQQVAEDGLDLLLAAAGARAPFVSTIHVTHSASELRARVAGPRDYVAERVLCRLAPPIVAVSEAAAVRLLRRPHLAAARVAVIHPAVPGMDSAVADEARRRAREEWGVGEETVVIGAAGRIERQKNPLFLLDHVKGLVASGRDCRLVWIGDGEMRQALEARASEASMRDRLIVEGWRDDARRRMAGIDVFAMPSRFEGLPLALLEAMHSGRAVCVSDADGMPEAVRDGIDGLVRPLSAAASWREALDALVTDAELRASLGATARRSARRRFSLDAMAEATLALYRAAAGQRAPGRHDALAV